MSEMHAVLDDEHISMDISVVPCMKSSPLGVPSSLPIHPSKAASGIGGSRMEGKQGDTLGCVLCGRVAHSVHRVWRELPNVVLQPRPERRGRRGIGLHAIMHGGSSPTVGRHSAALEWYEQM